MARRKRRGPIASTIVNLCSRTLLKPAYEVQFKEGLRKIVNEWGPAFFYHICLAIQVWVVDYIVDRKDAIWQLVDQVEPRIRQEFEKLAD